MNRSGTQHRKLPERLILVLAGAARPMLLQLLADAVGTHHTSTRYALGRMSEQGLIRRSRDGYELRIAGDVLTFELRRAVRALGVRESLRLLAVANPAIELLTLGLDRATAHAVAAGDARAADLLRLRDAARELLDVDVVVHEQRELLGRTIEDEERLARFRTLISDDATLKGDIEGLPRPGVRGDFSSARPLGRLHPSLARLSRRKLQDIARRYGINALSLFGSAVRHDFRADSDVDVLVNFRPRAHRTISSIGDLSRELGEVLGRKVDIVDERNVYPGMAANIARDVVRVYGRSRTHSLASRASERARRPSDRRTIPLRRLGRRSRNEGRDLAPGRGGR